MKKFNKTAWDKAFKKEGKIFIKPQVDMPKVVKLFKEQGIRKVLDLGCGSGRHLVYLAKRGFDVFGIDISKHGIKIAREELKKKNLKAHLKVGDMHKRLPYKDDFFDAIISIQTLNHGRISEIRRTIKEIKRTLRPQGLIFITVSKLLPKRCIPKDRRYGIKYITPRTYIILGGPEKGLIHYQFNKKILKKEFKNFKILDFWISPKSRYCLLGKIKE